MVGNSNFPGRPNKLQQWQICRMVLMSAVWLLECGNWEPHHCDGRLGRGVDTHEI